jgi:dienelactone hydrolase
MSIITRIAGLALVAGVALAPMAAAAQPSDRPTPPTVEQMAALPLMSSFAISPDGRHMAALQARGDDNVILVWETANLGEEPTVIGATQMRIRSVSFVKNDTLAVNLWQPFDANYGGVVKTFLTKLMFTDLRGRNWRDPMDAQRTRSESEAEFARLQSPTILDILPNDPDDILVQLGGDVLRLNVRTNRAERVQRASERVIDYETDLAGELRARAIVDRDGEGLYIATEFRNASGGWEEHFRSHIRNRETFAIASFSADPNIAYVISNRGRDKSAIFEYNIATRTLGEVVFEHPLFEATGVSIERTEGPDFGEVLSFGYAGPRSSSYPVAPEYESLVRGLEAALGVENHPVEIVDPATGDRRTLAYPTERYMRIQSASDDWSTAVVWAGGPNDPGAYYLYTDGRLAQLGQPYPGIDPEALGSTSLVYYEARDGLTIPAFLSTPSEALYGEGPYPSVIMPHGGPWARDEMTWDSSMWRWLMTSRGYAVLQPQYRGSDGWGNHLWTAGDNEWGQAMQDDKDDGARWLIEQGIAQEGRIAMFGFSYGGYAAMTAAVRPNGLYRCAIAGAGVSDLTRIRSQLFTNPYTREAQRDTVSGLSPVSEAQNIQIPIMVFQGERDRTVTQDHSDNFVARARNSGQDVQYHLIADYAHGPAWTTGIMAEQLGYIDDYLENGCGGSGL